MAVGVAAQNEGGDPEEQKFENLLEGESLDQWKHVFPSDAKEQAAGTWVHHEGILKCSGQPLSYLRTKQKYANYILRLKWRYPKAAKGNSGILLHVQEPDKVWPKCFQVQLLTDEAGSIFPLEGAKSDNQTDPKGVCRPQGEWNTWEIHAEKGKIVLSVITDGKAEAKGTITGCDPGEGYIALQSEGSEVEFRDVTIKRLP